MSAVLSIFSPNQNAYSETFIQVHKKLPFDVRYYFGGNLPGTLEGRSMATLPWNLRIEKKLLKRFSPAEKKMMFSLKNEKVQAVLAEYGPTAAESLPVIQCLKLPLIVHFHGFDASAGDIINSYKDRYEKVFDYASAVIAVSDKMKNDLIKMGCPADKISVTVCAPSEEFLKLIPDYNATTFIAIGRFVEKKAPHLTIFAFGKVVEKYPAARLKMIGDGPLWQVCKDLAIQLGLEDRVEFLGVQLPSWVQYHMEHSIAFVQHSVTAPDGDSEGTPVAVLEAQAAALPVIATHHAGIPGVVLDGQTGLLCKEHDVDAMAENMMKILEDQALARRLGTAGRERIKSHFTMKRHLEVLTHVIDKAIEGVKAESSYR